ncbi:MAG: hypothetical protein ACJAX3_001699 [Patiriisocius sp.]|jgi:hypothetical protein
MKNVNRYLLRLSAVFLVSLFLTSCVCEDCVPASHLEEPVKIISLKQAKNMYDIYTDRKVGALKEMELRDGTAADYNPTRYVQYSFEEMKHYLNYIESESSKAGITVENLRIYFGAYPESGDFPSGDPARYSRQNSIFILPTTMHSGMQKGFYTTGAENKKERYAVYLRDYDGDLSKMDGRRRMKEFKGSLLSTTLFQKDSIPDDRSLILNDGQVIPPPEQNTDMDGRKGKK